MVYTAYDTPFGVTNREMLVARVIRKKDNKTYALTASVNDVNTPVKEGRVRAVILSVWCLEAELEGQTTVTRILQLDPKGNIPTFVVNSYKTKPADGMALIRGILNDQ